MNSNKNEEKKENKSALLNKNEINFLVAEINSSQNPLIFYDDDPDGLCSFILLYKIRREGKGIIVKAAPVVDEKFLRKVEENNPDKIFILDMPIVTQEFLDKLKRPTFWIDHHNVLERKNVHYFNPHQKDPESYIPTTRMIYQLNQKKEDLWIATIGCLADWHMPDFISEFIESYPHLLPKKTTLEKAVYHYPVGKLVKIFSFLLKGTTSEVNRYVKILTRIQTPEEILNQETAQGKFLYKQFEKVNQKYEELIKEAKKKVTRSKLLLYNYSENKISFTTELANELINTYPNKVVLITRKKSGEMKCSLRSKTPIAKILEKALIGIEGYGGGHPNACGAAIKEESWDQFLINLKREIKQEEN